MPAPASRAAIPPPIIPEPMTAADRIFLGIMASSSIVGINNEWIFIHLSKTLFICQAKNHKASNQRKMLIIYNFN
jgi:hypothetical protein